MIVVRGRTSQLIDVRATSSNGLSKTGLVFNTSGLVAYYHRELSASATAITLQTMTAGTWASGGFIEISSGNMPGTYSVGIPDAAISASDASTYVVIQFSGATDAVIQPVRIDLVAINVQDSVRQGLTALPNAAAEAAGGLYTRGTGAGQINQANNGQIDANAVRLGGTTLTARDIGASVLLSTGTGTGQLDFASGIVKSNETQILGTAISTPATAGILDVNLKNIANSVVSTTTAQLGVNAVQIGAAVPASATIGTVTTVTTATNLTNAATAGDFTATMKTSLNAATPASVVGAVGSVSGNVGGNVTGSVGSVLGNVAGNVVGTVASVIGAVGSVTGNVGGNVIGSVASVVGNVGGNVVGTVASVVATVNANLTQILGTALTETAGLLAGGFKKFFNVSGPTLTTAGVDQTGDSFARIGALGAGLTALAPSATALTSATWTNARAALLDNADVATSTRLPTVDMVSTSGTAQSGSATNIRLSAGAPSVNLTGQTVFILTGTGALQSSPITAYNTTTKDATTTWTTAPASGSTYVVLALQGGSSSGGGGATVDAIWNEPDLLHRTANTMGGDVYASFVKTALITGQTVSVQGADVSGSTVSGLFPGDTYTYPGNALFGSVVWSNATGDLSTATITLYAQIAALPGAAAAFTGASGGTTSAYVNMTTTETLQFGQNSYYGQLKAVYLGGAEQTLWAGQLDWSTNISTS